MEEKLSDSATPDGAGEREKTAPWQDCTGPVTASKAQVEQKIQNKRPIIPQVEEESGCG